MSFDGQLEGKVALVTGGGAGIGRATAKLLHAHGATVVIVDAVEPSARAVAAEIEQDGGRAEAVTLDLADSKRVAGLVDDVVARHGHLDILVNNAGITGAAPLLEITEEQWDRATAVNLKAPFLLTQAFGRHVVQRGGGGKIVNVLSSSLFRAVFTSGPDYVTTKGGLQGLTRAAAGYLAPYDVNVNCVTPGITDTPRVRNPEMSDAEHDAMMTKLATEGPLANSFGRYSKPEDVAEAIVFLCLPGSRQMTGQTLHTSAGSVV